MLSMLDASASMLKNKAVIYSPFLVNKVQMARLHPSLYLHQPLCLSATSLHFKEALTALLISTFGPFFSADTETFIYVY